MAYSTSLAGSKLRAKLGATLNEGVSAPTSDFAQNQLKKLGWSDGDGLGKRRQGRASHITVTKREDNVGLGHSGYNQDATQQWWKDSVGDTLAKLSSKKSKKKKPKRVKEYTDEELFEATGGARFGMRAQRRATAKWARTESQTEDDERQAKEKMDWNGRGDAKIRLETSESDRPKKKRRKNTDEESDVNASDESAVNDASSSEVETKVKKKKKDKKQKKKKKSKKKSKKLKQSEAEEAS
jgi:Pin2-interacting protein X1